MMIGILPAATSGGGMALAFPDVCKVPVPPAGPIPVPMPNIAALPMANKAQCPLMTKFVGNAPFTQESMVMQTNGDQAGVAMGVSSSTIMGPAQSTLFSLFVKVEGTAAVYMGCITRHNQNNAPIGIQAVPSQIKVLLLG
jgi:hypothetical protein